MIGMKLRRRNKKVMRGKRIYMREKMMRDYERWERIREKRREFIKKWEKKWKDEEMKRSEFR